MPFLPPLQIYILTFYITVGKKCTYGKKCKFFHPERLFSHMSITDRLKENDKERRKQPSREAKSLAIELVESESKHGVSTSSCHVSTM